MSAATAMPGWLASMIGLGQLLLVGLVLSVILVTWITIHRLRHPPRRTYSWAVARSLPGDPSELEAPREYETIDLTFPKLSTRAWIIPGDAPDGPLIICTPGWGDSKIGILPRLEALVPYASRIVAWDPPGHAEASGAWDFGLRTAPMLLEIIRTLRASDTERVILFGWSMGAGVSIAAAAHDAADNTNLISGVIAEAPYAMPWTPAYRVLHLSGLPWRINGPIAFALLGIMHGVGPRWRATKNGLPAFDRTQLAARLTCPLRIIHTDTDEVCPIEDARAIAAAAPDAQLSIIHNGTHNTLWTNPETRSECIEAVGEFLTSVGDRAGRSTVRA